MESTKLLVERIEKGTVIDHLPVGTADRVMREILKLDPTKDTIILLYNVRSTKYGRKDILKITGKHLSDKETSLISLIAPTATINEIEDYKVIRKYKVKIPEIVRGILRCPNYNCITNDEREKIETEFTLANLKSGIYFKCSYCDCLIRLEEVANYLI